MHSERELIAACLALLDGRQVDLSSQERSLMATCASSRLGASHVDEMRRAILRGGDPLGEAFASIRCARHRRAMGAVYTPQPIVKSMLSWLAEHASPVRIVDPGAGSGRFVLAAGALFPDAQLLAIEQDPLAALMTRANASVRGWTDRMTVLVGDYRELVLPQCAGTTAFIGNPPYLRHHDIDKRWKKWFASRFAVFGIKASALAGLHLHFLLQTRLLAHKGDVGVFVTSAEWLDVNYGDALRRLLLDELGGLALHVLEPAVEAFPGTATTAAIICFRVGESRLPMRVRPVAALADLNGLSEGVEVAREKLRAERRWSVIVRPSSARQDGEIDLGELFGVHRGQVTGANAVWIAGDKAQNLPERVMIPAVTKARDLMQAGAVLPSAKSLRRVIDLPCDLDEFDPDERSRVSAFLGWARAHGANEGYIARHRKVWWSVGLKAPAPILCTYMARRPPQFTLNACGARHINVAHGLYPREPLTATTLARLVDWLNANVSQGSGRTYAGGLTKFEPKEVERLRIPGLAALAA